MYSGNTEIKEESVVFEESVGLRASWQATNDLCLTGTMYVPYNYYRTTGDTIQGLRHTAERSDPPARLRSQVRPSGYILNVGGSRGWRPGWNDFGLSTSVQGNRRNTYDIYYGEFKKNFFTENS